MSLPSVPVLSVRDLGCGYGQVRVVENLDFDVSAGEALMLTGPNGSGKSTVLRTAAAQQPALTGRCLLAGRPMVENSARYRREVSSLFDEDAFLPGLGVAQHLELVARGHRLPDPGTVVAQTLEEFGLTGHAGASPFVLSSGQRRRVLLAAALLRPFALLVLDEPEQRLDAAMRGHLIRRLVSARQAGAALLIATHQRDLAATVGTARLAIGGEGNREHADDAAGRCGGRKHP